MAFIQPRLRLHPIFCGVLDFQLEFLDTTVSICHALEVYSGYGAGNRGNFRGAHLHRPLVSKSGCHRMKKSQVPTTQRLEALDSIRGLAALAVLFGHTCGTFVWPVSWVKWIRWPLFNMAFDGRSAVAMFFVLSGFVLSRPYVSSISPPLNVPVFYIRRLFSNLVAMVLRFCGWSGLPPLAVFPIRNPTPPRPLLLATSTFLDRDFETVRVSVA